MAATAKFKLVIVWEDELRKAAKLLREAAKVDTPEAHQSAYAACVIALHGLDDDKAGLAMCASSDIMRHASP